LKATWFKDKIIERQVAAKILPKQVVNRKKQPFFFPLKYFFESPQFNELVRMTLNKTQILKRGYFNPSYIEDLLNKMKTREFIYLKQVVSLVILELWHMVFIDQQGFEL
jgi:asparagine synthase (glutamine-hydrolysing)